MSKKNYHIVNKQIFDLAFNGVEDAFALEQEISQVNKKYLLAQMEKVFDEFVPADRLLQLDKLELDIGTINENELNGSFIDLVLKTLREKLELLRHEPKWGDGEPLAPRTVDQWMYFLRTGTLPWNGSNLFMDDWKKDVIVTLKKEKGKSVELRQLLVSNEMALRRFVVQHDENTLAVFMRTLTGRDAGELIAYRKLLQVILSDFFKESINEKIPQLIDPSFFKCYYWRNVVKAVIERNNVSNFRKIIWLFLEKEFGQYAVYRLFQNVLENHKYSKRELKMLENLLGERTIKELSDSKKGRVNEIGATLTSEKKIGIDKGDENAKKEKEEFLQVENISDEILWQKKVHEKEISPEKVEKKSGLKLNEDEEALPETTKQNDSGSLIDKENEVTEKVDLKKDEVNSANEEIIEDDFLIRQKVSGLSARESDEIELVSANLEKSELPQQEKNILDEESVEHERKIKKKVGEEKGEKEYNSFEDSKTDSIEREIEEKQEGEYIRQPEEFSSDELFSKKSEKIFPVEQEKEQVEKKVEGEDYGTEKENIVKPSEKIISGKKENKKTIDKEVVAQHKHFAKGEEEFTKENAGHKKEVVQKEDSFVSKKEENRNREQSVFEKDKMPDEKQIKEKFGKQTGKDENVKEELVNQDGTIGDRRIIEKKENDLAGKELVSTSKSGKNKFELGEEESINNFSEANVSHEKDMDKLETGKLPSSESKSEKGEGLIKVPPEKIKDAKQFNPEYVEELKSGQSEENIATDKKSAGQKSELHDSSNLNIKATEHQTKAEEIAKKTKKQVDNITVHQSDEEGFMESEKMPMMHQENSDETSSDPASFDREYKPSGSQVTKDKEVGELESQHQNNAACSRQEKEPEIEKEESPVISENVESSDKDLDEKQVFKNIQGKEPDDGNFKKQKEISENRDIPKSSEPTPKLKTEKKDTALLSETNPVSRNNWIEAAKAKYQQWWESLYGKSNDAAEEMVPIGSSWYLNAAGLVLLHPFLTHFFKVLGLVEGKDFVDEPARHRAVHLLQYLASGETKMPEYKMILPKFLCNMPFEIPIEREIKLTKEELEESEQMLEAVIKNWGALGESSPDALREGFLQRDGKLEKREGGWYLMVEQKTIDILLEKLPWNISIIRLPWREELLKVEWA